VSIVDVNCEYMIGLLQFLVPQTLSYV